MLLKPKIFRAYDIRGEAFVDFDEDGFMAIAQAFGQYIKDKFLCEVPRIFVSGDGRTSLPELFPAVITGLQAAGCQATWGGIIPTPINYFAFHEGDFDASIQISASHNPAADNGLKLMDRNGSVCGKEIQKIRSMAECIDCLQTKQLGTCEDDCKIKRFTKPYHEKLHAIVPKQKPLKIVLDAGNSVSGMYYPEILQQFGHKVVELYCALDTTFPNHQPDPEETDNLTDLIVEVNAVKADIGFAYDGDGDRVGVVLPDGQILLADHIFYVLACDFLARNPNEKLIVDAMSSQALIRQLEDKGAQVIISPTGHSFIEQNMHKHNAKLAGEQSGHFMFGEDFYGHDDAILATLRFIQAIQSNPMLLESVTTQWPKMAEHCEKLTVADEHKFEILENFIKKLTPVLDTMGIHYDLMDGIRIRFGGDEWAIVRCSNTSPKISIRIEADNETSLINKKQLLMDYLRAQL